MADRIIKFTIMGNPQPQQRSGQRFRGVNPVTGRAIIQHFDQPKSAAFKQMVRMEAMAAMTKEKLRIIPPHAGPVIMEAVIKREIPKSWSHKKKHAAAAGVIFPITKPDLKNYIWGIEDALNGIMWRDDSQIISWGLSMKVYTDGLPGVDVTIVLKEAES